VAERKRAFDPALDLLTPSKSALYLRVRRRRCAIGGRAARGRRLSASASGRSGISMVSSRRGDRLAPSVARGVRPPRRRAACWGSTVCAGATGRRAGCTWRASPGHARAKAVEAVTSGSESVRSEVAVTQQRALPRLFSFGRPKLHAGSTVALIAAGYVPRRKDRSSSESPPPRAPRAPGGAAAGPAGPGHLLPHRPPRYRLGRRRSGAPAPCACAPWSCPYGPAPGVGAVVDELAWLKLVSRHEIVPHHLADIGHDGVDYYLALVVAVLVQELVAQQARQGPAG
jgi:hypothetical protein